MSYLDWTDERLHRPISRRLLRWVPRGVTPNQVTVSGLITGLAASGATWGGAWLTAAALLQVSMVLDCLDGDLARTRGQVSDWGDVYDHVADDVRFVAMAAALLFHVPLWLALPAGAVAWLLAGQQHYYNLERNEGAGYFHRRREAVGRLSGPLARYFVSRLASLERGARALNPDEVPGGLPAVWPWRFAGVSTLSLLVSLSLVLGVPEVAAWLLVAPGLPYAAWAVTRERRAARGGLCLRKLSWETSAKEYGRALLALPSPDEHFGPRWRQRPGAREEVWRVLFEGRPMGVASIEPGESGVMIHRICLLPAARGHHFRLAIREHLVAEAFRRPGVTRVWTRILLTNRRFLHQRMTEVVRDGWIYLGVQGEPPYAVFSLSKDGGQMAEATA